MESTREASLHLTRDVSSLGEGRRFVARTLREWAVDEQCIESVLLAANELVANAIVHAHSAPVLSLEAAGADLLLRVADASSRLPAASVNPESDAAGGRGLILVEAVGDRWGADLTEAGKTVWVEFVGACA